jgi:hypothetical protein
MKTTKSAGAKGSSAFLTSLLRDLPTDCYDSNRGAWQNPLVGIPADQ